MWDRIESAIQLEDNSWLAQALVRAFGPRRPDTYRVDYIFRMDASHYGRQGGLGDLVAGRRGAISCPHVGWVPSVDRPTCNGCAIGPSILGFSGGDVHKGARPPPPRATILRATIGQDRLARTRPRSANTHGEITEAATANIVVGRDGEATLTPPSSGLPAGTFRAELLPGEAIRKAVVTVGELRSTRGVRLINAAHEWRRR